TKIEIFIVERLTEQINRLFEELGEKCSLLRCIFGIKKLEVIEGFYQGFLVFYRLRVQQFKIRRIELLGNFFYTAKIDNAYPTVLIDQEIPRMGISMYCS